MTGLQLSGLASGLDTDSIISQLMAVERQPRTRLTLQQTATQARQDALKDIQSKVSALRTAATALGSAGTWGDTQTATSSDDAALGVRRLGGAAPGGHEVVVSQLARGTQTTADFTASASSSSLTVNGKQVDLAAGATLDDAVAAINATSDVGVFAVNAGGRLALASRTTGAASAASVTGSAVANQATLAGADAAFTVDGQAFTRPTNVVGDALVGVELTLKAKTAGATATITPPGADPDAVKDAATNFVEAYNDVVDAVRSRTQDKAVPTASTSTDVKKGVLHGDSGLNQMLSGLRSALGGTLASLGISTGATTGGSLDPDAVAGKLKLDSTKLTSALTADPAALRTKLTAFSTSFDTTLAPLAQSGGVLDQRVTSAGSDLTNLATRLTAFDTRMDTKETNLRKIYTALETAIQKNNSALSQFTAALGSS